jgi:hypothetical protein
VQRSPGPRVVRRAASRGATPIGIVTTDLGLSLLEAGEHGRARSVLRESLHELQGAGEQRYIIFALLGLALIAHDQGEPRHAVRLLSAAEVQRTSIGMQHAVYGRKAQTQFASLRQQLSAPAFDATHAEGTAMSLDQVLAEVAVTS